VVSCGVRFSVGGITLLHRRADARLTAAATAHRPLRLFSSPPTIRLPARPLCLHGSSLPSLPCAMCCHLQRRTIPRPRHAMEFLSFRLAARRRFAHTTRETLLLTVTLSNEQPIEIHEAVVRWSGGRSVRWRMLRSNDTPMRGSSIV
jgi:hypothetical protein